MVDNHRPMEHIVIVGRGLVAAGTVVTMARLLKEPRVRVTWVQYGAKAPPGVEVADPAFGRWLGMVGYPERQLVQECQGLYSLGTDYRTPARGFFVPYGAHGIAPSPAPFEHEFFRRFHGEAQLAYNEHFLATQAARLGRFDFPVDDPRSVKSTLRYGLHLDRSALVDCLARYARAQGVECIVCESCRPDVGMEADIRSLTLDNGRQISGDFYLDTEGALVTTEEEPATESVEWRYRVSYSEPAESPWRPCSTMTREPWGWTRHAGLQDRTGVDAWVKDKAALDALVATLKDKTYSVRALEVKSRAAPWQGNCLALGAAAGWPGDPVLSEWHWACRALLLWLELLPDAAGRPHLRAEFNRRHKALYQSSRELAALHGEQRRETMPESLAWRQSVFQRFGRRWRRDDEPLPDETWFALVLGLGWHSEGCDITLWGNGQEARLSDKHHRILQTLQQAAESMPTLETVLNRQQ